MNKIMELLTKHFDLTENYCILDLITDTHVFYLEFDNNHKIIDKMTFKLPTIEEYLKAII